jgi:hypothetical protein
LLGKSILNGDILSLNPPKLAQLLAERLQKSCHTRSSASIQKTYAEDFSRLLRACPRPDQREREHYCKKPRPFSIFDFGFWIIGQRIRESHPRSFNHALLP